MISMTRSPHLGYSQFSFSMKLMMAVVVKLMWQGMGGMMYVEEDDLCSHDFHVSLENFPFLAKKPVGRNSELI